MALRATMRPSVIRKIDLHRKKIQTRFPRISRQIVDSQMDTELFYFYWVLSVLKIHVTFIGFRLADTESHGIS